MKFAIFYAIMALMTATALHDTQAPSGALNDAPLDRLVMSAAWPVFLVVAFQVD